MKYDVFHRQSYFVKDVMPAKEMAEYFEDRLGWLITSLWELNCKDADDTLAAVTSRVLTQADVSKEEIRLRAEAIKEIATVFQVRLCHAGSQECEGSGQVWIKGQPAYCRLKTRFCVSSLNLSLVCEVPPLHGRRSSRLVLKSPS